MTEFLEIVIGNKGWVEFFYILFIIFAIGEATR